MCPHPGQPGQGEQRAPPGLALSVGPQCGSSWNSSGNCGGYAVRWTFGVRDTGDLGMWWWQLFYRTQTISLHCQHFCPGCMFVITTITAHLPVCLWLLTTQALRAQCMSASLMPRQRETVNMNVLFFTINGVTLGSEICDCFKCWKFWEPFFTKCCLGSSLRRGVEVCNLLPLPATSPPGGALGLSSCHEKICHFKIAPEQ